MTDQTDALDYQTPTPAPSRPRVDLGTIVLCALIAGIWTFTLVLVVPRFEAVFRDFGVRLPLVTAVLLKASRAVMLAPVWLGLVWVVAAVPVAMSIPLGRVGRRILRGILYLVLAATVAGFAVALFAPYVGMINAISGKKA
jgi:hypothetical protein